MLSRRVLLDVGINAIHVGLLRVSLFGNKESGGQAKHGNNRSKQPGSVFQHVRRLFNTHDLVADAGKAPGKTAPF